MEKVLCLDEYNWRIKWYTVNKYETINQKFIDRRNIDKIEQHSSKKFEL